MKKFSVLCAFVGLWVLVSSGVKANDFELVLSEHYESGHVSVFVRDLGSASEKWRFSATANSGASMSLYYSPGSSFARLHKGSMLAEFVESGNAADGWIEFVGGPFHGFFSDTWGNIADPFGPGHGDNPPGVIQGWNEQATSDLSSLIEEILASKDMDLRAGYLDCVGAVTGAVAGTIFGAQHHSSNVQAYRARQISRFAVRSSGVALGAVVIGGAAVSAAVCVQIFLH